MRTLIRLFFSLFGYNVYFIKREQQIDSLLLNNQEFENKEWANEKVASRFESKASLSFYNLVLSKIEELKIIINNKCICDIGCGNGILLSIISNKYKPAYITGMDFSEEAVKLARQREIYNSVFITHDIYKKIDQEKYDLILCTEVLEHLEYPDLALKNVLDALSPQGIAFITVPNGRLDFFEGHINFWSVNSWNIFLQKTISNSSYYFESGILDRKVSHLFAIIRKS